MERDVAVPDEDELLRRRRQAGVGDARGEDVLPHRVARARVEEPDALALAPGLQRLEERTRLRLEVLGRPGVADGRVGREDLEVEAAEGGEVVVSYQAHVRPLRHEGAAAVRARAVADEVAQAPELVGRVPVDRLEHRLEGMEVPVDVGDNGGAHGRRTLAKGLALVAAVVLWAVAAVLLWRTEVPDLSLPDLAPERLLPRRAARPDRGLPGHLAAAVPPLARDRDRGAGCGRVEGAAARGAARAHRSRPRAHGGARRAGRRGRGLARDASVSARSRSRAAATSVSPSSPGPAG